MRNRPTQEQQGAAPDRFRSFPSLVPFFASVSVLPAAGDLGR
jgi:hypothetical protein